MGTADDTNAAGDTRSKRRRDRGQRSPAISRLEETLPKRSPVRGIIGSAAGLVGDDLQLSKLQTRLARLERRQLELVSAQRKTNATLRRLNRRVWAEVERLRHAREEGVRGAQAVEPAWQQPRAQPMWRQRGLVLVQVALSLLVVAALVAPAIVGLNRLAEESATRPAEPAPFQSPGPITVIPTQTVATGQIATPRAGASAASTASPTEKADVTGSLRQPPTPTMGPAHSSCGYVGGIAALVGALGGDTVGQCLDNERTNPANGNREQLTTNGLLFWLKADNVAAFTNGATTWYACPAGIERRSSDQPPPCSGL